MNSGNRYGPIAPYGFTKSQITFPYIVCYFSWY